MSNELEVTEVLPEGGNTVEQTANEQTTTTVTANAGTTYTPYVPRYNFQQRSATNIEETLNRSRVLTEALRRSRQYAGLNGVGSYAGAYTSGYGYPYAYGNRVGLTSSYVPRVVPQVQVAPQQVVVQTTAQPAETTETTQTQQVTVAPTTTAYTPYVPYVPTTAYQQVIQQQTVVQPQVQTVVQPVQTRQVVQQAEVTTTAPTVTTTTQDVAETLRRSRQLTENLNRSRQLLGQSQGLHFNYRGSQYPYGYVHGGMPGYPYAYNMGNQHYHLRNQYVPNQMTVSGRDANLVGSGVVVGEGTLQDSPVMLRNPAVWSQGYNYPYLLPGANVSQVPVQYQQQVVAPQVTTGGLYTSGLVGGNNAYTNYLLRRSQNAVVTNVVPQTTTVTTNVVSGNSQTNSPGGVNNVAVEEL